MNAAGASMLDWFDRDEMCRVCLCPNPVAKWNLFECTIVGRSIAEVLVEVAGVPIQKGDNYPTVCCSECLKQVEAAGKLREQCQVSNRRLGQIFEMISGVVVKQESPENVEEPVGDEPMELDSSAIPLVEASLAIAAIHGMPEEPAPAPVVEGSSQNSTIISSFKVDGLDIRIELPNLQNILEQSAAPSLLEPIPASSEVIPATTTVKYECCGCPSTFDTEEQFDEHVRSFHEPRRVALERIRKGFFECFRCYRLVKNMKIHHTRGNFCQICSKLFRDHKELNEHYSSKHSIFSKLKKKPTPNHECCGCSQVFTTEKAFEEHVKTVHKPMQVPKQSMKPGWKECYRCLKAVKRLKEHHIRDRYCKICGWQFEDEATASNHYRTKHSYKGDHADVKVCCGCATPFPTIGALKIHSNQVHYKHKSAFDAERPFQCEICFENHRNYTELDEHQTKYQKTNKPHWCDRCERSFFFLNSLRDHERTHKS